MKTNYLDAILQKELTREQRFLEYKETVSEPRIILLNFDYSNQTVKEIEQNIFEEPNKSILDTHAFHGFSLDMFDLDKAFLKLPYRKALLFKQYDLNYISNAEQDYLDQYINIVYLRLLRQFINHKLYFNNRLNYLITNVSGNNIELSRRDFYIKNLTNGLVL
jgi:hypothetical protein